MEVSQQAIEGLYRVMKIPKEYHLFYQPSATVAMDTILRNLVQKRSFHFVHGAFSQRFLTTAREQELQVEVCECAWDEVPPWEKISPSKEVECLMLTHNETSTGLMWPEPVLQKLRERFKDTLLAIDTTSSFGGTPLDWKLGDAWFFSVQKCLGLPAGLGCIVLSPRAFEKSRSARGVASWQHFPQMAKKMDSYQTVETPNVFAIALLAHRLKTFNPTLLHSQLQKHAQLWYEAGLPWTPYIKDSHWRSLTVLNFLTKHPEKWIAFGQANGFLLGKGYGPLKESCIRIANFPNFKEHTLRETIRILKTMPHIPSHD